MAHPPREAMIALRKRQRGLHLHNSGSPLAPGLIAGEPDGSGPAGAGVGQSLCRVDAGTGTQTLDPASTRGRARRLHPVHRTVGAADRRATSASRHKRDSGRLTAPPRTAVALMLH